MLIVFKTYVFAVPVALLLAAAVLSEGQVISDRDGTKWMHAERARIIALQEWGYAMCIVMLLLGAFAAYRAKDRGAMRSALLFACLALVSLAVLYPFSFVAPTR